MHFKHTHTKTSSARPVKSTFLPNVATRTCTKRQRPCSRILARAGASSEVQDASVQSSALRPFTPGNWPKVEANEKQRPVVILPGFGNNSGDYLAPFGDEESSLSAALKKRGFPVYVLPVERKDWFKVARSLLTLEYWSTKCTTDPGYTWYLERIKEAIDTARLETKSDQIDLIGHSAGGWLARAFLADPKFFESVDCENRGCHSNCNSLITLGTPHSPPPKEKFTDRTGGALTWVHQTWPGAYHDDHISYVSVAGRTVPGDKRAPTGTLFNYAHNSYLEVCGEGQGVEGDAVVPVQSAVLEGSESIVLDGVFHSMSRATLESQMQNIQHKRRNKNAYIEPSLWPAQSNRYLMGPKKRAMLIQETDTLLGTGLGNYHAFLTAMASSLNALQAMLVTPRPTIPNRNPNTPLHAAHTPLRQPLDITVFHKILSKTSKSVEAPSEDEDGSGQFTFNVPGGPLGAPQRPQGLRQLGGGRGSAFGAVPPKYREKRKSEIAAAVNALQGKKKRAWEPSLDLPLV